MAQIVKRLSDPYLITSADLTKPTKVTIGVEEINKADVTINGNLTVTGSQVNIRSTDMDIRDNIIVLNKDETGAGVSKITAGIQVDRGTATGVSILWNETAINSEGGVGAWTLTNDGATWLNIALIHPGSQYITAVVEDPTPELGGNLVTNGFSITSMSGTNLVLQSPQNIQLDSMLQLEHVAPPTQPVAGATLVHAGPVAGGESGVYVTNSLETNRELITERRAIVYSLIF